MTLLMIGTGQIKACFSSVKCGNSYIPDCPSVCLSVCYVVV